jgi:hypothetical protein
MSKIKIKYIPLPAQKIVFEDDVTENIMHAGGLGSGKSYNLVMKLLRLSKLNKGFAGGLMCPDFPSFKKDIKPTFEMIFDASKLKKGKHWQYHQTDKYYTFSWNKSPLYVFSAEKEIAGPNLGYGGINEFSLCPWDRVNEFIRRVRMDAPFKQRVFAGTPEDKFGWLQDYVNMMNAQVVLDPDKFRIIHGDTTENIHIDKDYYKTLEYLLDEKALKCFKEGHIIKISGDLFYYAFDRKKNVSDQAIFRPGQTVYANMDFNVGRMTCTFAHKNGVYDDFFDEFELLGNSDTPQACTEIKKRYGTRNVVVTIDSSGKNRKTSGASDFQMIIDAGFEKNNIRFKMQNPRFRQRQLLVNGRLDKGLIRINPKNKITIKDLEQVEQNRLTFEKIKDKAGKLTHASDTLDYFIDYEYTLFTNRTSSTVQL